MNLIPDAPCSKKNCTIDTRIDACALHKLFSLSPCA